MNHNQAIIGKPAPEFQLERWVQGEARSLQQLKGNVVLAEVFQVNCPGCFVHALPEVMHLHDSYKDDGLVVIGIATAFEDFDRNTGANLERLLEDGSLQGDPLQQLGRAGLLEHGHLDYRLEFPVAMDASEAVEADTSTASVREFILQQLPEFDTMADDEKAIIIHNARDYLSSRKQLPLTFNCYKLQGTPSSILIDREGILRDVSFGWANHLDPLIRELL